MNNKLYVENSILEILKSIIEDFLESETMLDEDLTKTGMDFTKFIDTIVEI